MAVEFLPQTGHGFRGPRGKCGPKRVLPRPGKPKSFLSTQTDITVPNIAAADNLRKLSNLGRAVGLPPLRVAHGPLDGPARNLPRGTHQHEDLDVKVQRLPDSLSRQQVRQPA